VGGVYARINRPGRPQPSKQSTEQAGEVGEWVAMLPGLDPSVAARTGADRGARSNRDRARPPYPVVRGCAREAAEEL